jgi:hypothetical protein
LAYHNYTTTVLQRFYNKINEFNVAIVGKVFSAKKDYLIPLHASRQTPVGVTPSGRQP